MELPGIRGIDKVDRVESGAGYVHEHSIEIGNSVLALAGIGTITLVTGVVGAGPLVLGVLLGVVGLLMLKMIMAVALVLLAIAAALIIWHFSRQPDLYLSIGTCDGWRTHIVSKDRAFLLKVRDFLRDKLDRKSAATATINISAGTITGGIAVGAHAQAAGADSVINNAA